MLRNVTASGSIMSRASAAKWTTASGGRGAPAVLEAREGAVGGERVEDLTAVGEVGDERGDAVERPQVDVQHRVAVREAGARTA